MRKQPAFPTDNYYDEKIMGQTEGMTLRDYFAAAALQGIIANLKPDATVKQAVADAWEIANAMLEARPE